MNPIFFSPGDVTQKECFFCVIWVLKVSCVIWVLKVSLRLTVIQKGGLCPLRSLPLMIEFSVCAPSWCSTREELACGERFFEGLQNYMQNKNERNENKVILGDLNCTIDKIDRDGENKRQRLYRCCSNYTLSKPSWIMEKGESRFPRVHLLRWVFCQESKIDRV